jgi:protease-4
LKLELSGDIPELEGDQRWFGLLRRSSEDYGSLVSLLRWARDDEQLQGVLICCESVQASWGRIQGLRRGLERLRQAGKKVWVHLNGGGIHEYYLASTADHVTLTPAATLDITGLSSEAVFVLGALEKVGVHADVVQMGRYKSAAEMFTRRDMSASHREMMESLVDDLYGQVIEAVADSRSLSPTEVRETFDRGPFLAQEAKEAKLVDEVIYEDEAQEQLVAACAGSTVIDRTDYVRRRSVDARVRALRTPHGTVAVVHVCGTIKSGESVTGPDGSSAAGARSIAAAFKEVRERDDVRAVLVRVASPGGSGSASDLMWREMVRTKAEKPVVVSFGDVAASGGYYIALGADAIFAEPGTITGSIGVIAGKASLRSLYERVGVTKELVTRGKHATLFSDYAPLGDEERARLEAEASSFYRAFVEKVATGRKLSIEAAAASAEGRVWTGRQAWTRGLIDKLGDIGDALDAIKERLGVPIADPIAIESFPRPRRLLRLSVDLNTPLSGVLGDSLSLLRRFEFVLQERVWAMVPFSLRFF